MRAARLLFVVTAVAVAADIPQGTHVLLRLENSISTRTAKDGDYVYLRTVSPISVGGRIVVPEGTNVQGVISRSKRPGRVKGTAELSIRLETLTMPGGAVHKISPQVASVESEGTEQKVSKEGTVEQGRTRGQDAGKIAITAGSGAAIGGIADRSVQGASIGGGVGAAVGLANVLFTRGREVDLRRGSSLDVVFDRPVNLGVNRRIQRIHTFPFAAA